MDAIKTRIQRLKSTAGQLGWSQSHEDFTGGTPLDVVALQQDLSRTQKELDALLEQIPVVIERGLLRDVFAMAGAYCVGRENYLKSGQAQEDLEGEVLDDARTVAAGEMRQLALARLAAQGPGRAVETAFTAEVRCNG